MLNNNVGEMRFLAEMSDRQISTRQFFSHVLLDSMDRNFGLKKVLIACFDQEGSFLSWTDRNGVSFDGDSHPYTAFMPKDSIKQRIYEDAVRDKLDYSNLLPRVYFSTEMIPKEEYETSEYVKFLEDSLQAHYSAILAFGTNAYIHIVFYKSKTEGDFNDAEVQELQRIYMYVAQAYKNFKLHEHVKIISTIQDEIISSHENTYLITDDNMHILGYNKTAVEYLSDILGSAIDEQELTSAPCSWLPFLLGDTTKTDHVHVRLIKGYIFKIYTYEQTYLHGIIDRYHWITISKESEVMDESADYPVKDKDAGKIAAKGPSNVSLTKTEQKVAHLLCEGLTYQAIADELTVSYHTVKNHVQNIFTKCGVKNRYQLYQLFDQK